MIPTKAKGEFCFCFSLGTSQSMGLAPLIKIDLVKVCNPFKFNLSQVFTFSLKFGSRLSCFQGFESRDASGGSGT